MVYSSFITSSILGSQLTTTTAISLYGISIDIPHSCFCIPQIDQTIEVASKHVSIKISFKLCQIREL